MLACPGRDSNPIEAMKTFVGSSGYPTWPCWYKSFPPAPSGPVPLLPSRNRAGGQHWGSMRTQVVREFAQMGIARRIGENRWFTTSAPSASAGSEGLRETAGRPRNRTRSPAFKTQSM